MLFRNRKPYCTRIIRAFVTDGGGSRTRLVPRRRCAARRPRGNDHPPYAVSTAPNRLVSRGTFGQFDFRGVTRRTPMPTNSRSTRFSNSKCSPGRGRMKRFENQSTTFGPVTHREGNHSRTLTKRGGAAGKTFRPCPVRYARSYLECSFFLNERNAAVNSNVPVDGVPLPLLTRRMVNCRFTTVI